MKKIIIEISEKEFYSTQDEKTTKHGSLNLKSINVFFNDIRKTQASYPDADIFIKEPNSSFFSKLELKGDKGNESLFFNNLSISKNRDYTQLTRHHFGKSIYMLFDHKEEKLYEIIGREENSNHITIHISQGKKQKRIVIKGQEKNYNYSLMSKHHEELFDYKNNYLNINSDKINISEISFQKDITHILLKKAMLRKVILNNEEIIGFELNKSAFKRLLPDNIETKKEIEDKVNELDNIKDVSVLNLRLKELLDIYMLLHDVISKDSILSKENIYEQLTYCMNNTFYMKNQEQLNDVVNLAKQVMYKNFDIKNETLEKTILFKNVYMIEDSNTNEIVNVDLLKKIEQLMQPVENINQLSYQKNSKKNLLK